MVEWLVVQQAELEQLIAPRCQKIANTLSKQVY